jgi:hypothetical protein
MVPNSGASAGFPFLRLSDLQTRETRGAGLFSHDSRADVRISARDRRGGLGKLTCADARSAAADAASSAKRAIPWRRSANICRLYRVGSFCRFLLHRPEAAPRARRCSSIMDRTRRGYSRSRSMSRFRGNNRSSMKAHTRALALARRPVGNAAHRSMAGKDQSSSTAQTLPERSSGANSHSGETVRPGRDRRKQPHAGPQQPSRALAHSG